MQYSMTFRREISLCLPLLFFTGCAAYVPPSLPENETATLTNSDPYLRLEKIDGKSVGLGRYKGATTLAPGPHDITIIYHRETPGRMLSTRIAEAQGQVRLEATAGAKYVLGGSLVGYKVAFWIEDTQSGHVVAGVKPEPPGGTDPPGTGATR